MLSLKGVAAIHRLWPFSGLKQVGAQWARPLAAQGQAAVVSWWLRPGNEGPGMEVIL